MLVALFRKFSLLVPMRNPSESFSGRGNIDNDQHDTTRQDNDPKSVSPPDGTTNVRRRGRRFFMWTLWIYYVERF